MIAATALLTEALPRLASGELRRLLVVHDLQLVGLLSETDVMRVLEVRTRVASAATERRGPPTRRRRRCSFEPLGPDRAPSCCLGAQTSSSGPPR